MILERVGFEQDIIFENNDFFEDLQYHLTFMLTRLVFGVKINNPLLTDVKGNIL